MLILFLIGFSLNAQVAKPFAKDKQDQKQEKQQALNSIIGELSFHIIAGLYRNPDNADKKLNELKSLGYNARISAINQIGLTRVSYGSYKNRIDAINNLTKIKKSINKDAWLIVEKSSASETKWNEAVTESDSITKGKAVAIQELDHPTKQVKSQEVEAKILIKRVNGLVDISGIVENHSKIYVEGYNFNLLALKLDAFGNYLKNTQSGEFSLRPNERKNLATLKIVIKDRDELKLFFFIRKDGKLISKDTAIVVSKVKKLETKPMAEETIEINGLVVEDVVTKLGKDFYDFFYQEYNTSGAKYPFVIHVIEKPLLGINSEVRIDIDDKMVYKMTTRPNEDYLQSAARQAIDVINDYNEKRKFLYKKNIKF